MIIDCHGHYTTAPKPLQDFRDAQLAQIKAKVDPDNLFRVNQNIKPAIV